MAVAVVDRLEAVEIDHEQRELGVVAVAAPERGVQALAQRCAVGEPGQKVVHRERLDLALRLEERRLRTLQRLVESTPQGGCTGDREEKHDTERDGGALLDRDALSRDGRDHPLDEARGTGTEDLLVACIGLSIEDGARRRRVAPPDGFERLALQLDQPVVRDPRLRVEAIGDRRRGESDRFLDGVEDERDVGLVAVDPARLARGGDHVRRHRQPLVGEQDHIGGVMRLDQLPGGRRHVALEVGSLGEESADDRGGAQEGDQGRVARACRRLLENRAAVHRPPR